MRPAYKRILLTLAVAMVLLGGTSTDLIRVLTGLIGQLWDKEA